MPKNRIIALLGVALAIPLWALAQDPAPAPAPPAEVPPTAAEKTIDAAIDKLKTMKSASADLTVVADMLNQKIRLEGEYQKAPGNRVRMLLKLLGRGDETDVMLQVCDGTVLWNFATVVKTITCSQHKLEPILKVLNAPTVDAKMREDIMRSLGLAGPETLLWGLRKSFVFDQTDEGDLDGQKVWILRGSWQDAKTPVMPGGAPSLTPVALPPYVPGLVTLYLGKDDGWPYKVVFEGRKIQQIEQPKKKFEDVQSDQPGRPAAKKATPATGKPSTLILTYSKVKIGVAIPDETFAFAPPADAKPVDLTDRLVSQLENELNAAAARKKQQAEKAGPVLEGGLPAPAPGGDSPVKPVDAPKG